MYLMRFDMRAPGKSPEEIADLYQAAIEMSSWAEGKGCYSIVISEHHSSDDGYLPSPLTLASAIATATTSMPIMIAAAILPFYDPIRLAEDMIVLDHLSRGRVSYTLALGYRPEEYELFGLDYSKRAAIADEKLEALLGHLRTAGTDTGGPRVTPGPYTPGGPMICWGGSSKAAARRAGRFGLGFFAQSDTAGLKEAYEEAAREAGHEPGLCMLPSPDRPYSLFVNDDIDAGWDEVGEALLADARAYYAWNSEAGTVGKTGTLSAGSTVEELRASNASHVVITTEEAREMLRTQGVLSLQPLCGGLDPEVAWTYMRRIVDDVMPAAAPVP